MSGCPRFRIAIRSASFGRIVAAVMATGVALTTNTAFATDCSSHNHTSPCIDSDALWFSPPTSSWSSIAAAPPLERGKAAFSGDFTWLWRPVVLDAPSPDPAGREIVVVDSALDVTLGAVLGIGSGLSIDAALPLTVYQTGAGVEGLTSQSAPEIGATALKDPRLGIAFARAWSGYAADLVVETRMVASFPLGTADRLAGGRSAVAAPSLALAAEYGRLELASELGLRSRMTSELGGARVGSELYAALGIGADLDAKRRFTLRIEGWLRPSLVSQDHVQPDGTRIDNAVSMPAEWLAVFSALIDPRRGLTLGLGAGSGIPLSSERRTATDGSTSESTFSAITTPSVRLVAFARFVPGERR